ncbi:MAG: phosphotransferase [Candidatus Competibacteraceae bacterium]|jgi:aminoglycoside/choline kinase family phosphotransferase|nr:phosphotransferase [Candidatus Competibacteraceae bacterium]
MDDRYTLLLNWLGDVLPHDRMRLAPASEDASFRRYFRVSLDETTFIAMDSPPAQEDNRMFVVLAKALRELNVQTPQVFAHDFDQGFLLLSDFGPQQYLLALDDTNVDTLYADALAALMRLQLGADPASGLIPVYDKALLQQELGLFREWFLNRHLAMSLDDDEQRLLDEVFTLLCTSALEQPQVWVHRDYHSRNLMVITERNPGVLDFQGAVIGPVTYDLVSLLRDCYIAWPDERVKQWALDYRERMQAQGFQGLSDEKTFLRWFDWMGLQRHLKALGIFARLNCRDGKPGYLQDIPRTLNYVLEIAGAYPELSAFGDWLVRRELTPTALAREHGQ